MLKQSLATVVESSGYLLISKCRFCYSSVVGACVGSAAIRHDSLGLLNVQEGHKASSHLRTKHMVLYFVQLLMVFVELEIAVDSLIAN